jgi:hypothetical protein
VGADQRRKELVEEIKRHFTEVDARRRSASPEEAEKCAPRFIARISETEVKRSAFKEAGDPW